MLVASGNELYYHTWPRDEKHYYEIDFLLSRGAKICPVEVKNLWGLDKFIKINLWGLEFCITFIQVSQVG